MFSWFTSRLDKKIHQDLMDLYAISPLEYPMYPPLKASYGNDVFRIAEPSDQVDYEFDEITSEDVVVADFKHYRSGFTAFHGSNASDLVRGKITEAEWDKIIAECKGSLPHPTDRA